MHREICLVLVTALLLCGCVRRSVPPKAPPAKEQKAPAKPAQSSVPKVPERAVAPKPPVPALSPTEARDPVAVARRFLDAVAAGEYDRAVALCVPDKFTAQGFAQMNLAFQMDKAAIAQVWAGSQQAAVVTDLVPTKQGAVAAALWGLKLVRAEEGCWRIRDVDVLPDLQAVEQYLALFCEAEPDAKSIPL